jgi:hypothetical protein
MADRPLVTRGYLVVRADGSMRVTKTRVALNLDEVAFPLTVTIPATWGRVQTTSIDVALPDPPAPVVTVSDPQLVTP